LKEGFVLKKEKVYLLSREERKEVQIFTAEKKIHLTFQILSDIAGTLCSKER